MMTSTHFEISSAKFKKSAWTGIHLTNVESSSLEDQDTLLVYISVFFIWILLHEFFTQLTKMRELEGKKFLHLNKPRITILLILGHRVRIIAIRRMPFRSTAKTIILAAAPP